MQRAHRVGVDVHQLVQRVAHVAREHPAGSSHARTHRVQLGWVARLAAQVAAKPDAPPATAALLLSPQEGQQLLAHLGKLRGRARASHAAWLVVAWAANHHSH